ncbi:MAG: hypothetical protein AABY13_03900, partial [Nanoarchaeota archaeon]
MSLHNEWAKITRYFPPTRQEWLEFLLVALIFGFVISFNEWGAGAFDALEGLRNLLLATLLCALALAVHHGAQRLVGLRFDSRVQHHVWWTGLMLSLLFAFISRGALPFLAATGTTVEDMPLHRLGHFRYK